MAFTEEQQRLLSACVLVERVVSPEAVRSVLDTLRFNKVIVASYVQALLRHRNELERLAKGAGVADERGLLGLDPSELAYQVRYFNRLVAPYHTTGVFEVVLCADISANLLATVEYCRGRFLQMHPEDVIIRTPLPPDDFIE